MNLAAAFGGRLDNIRLQFGARVDEGSNDDSQRAPFTIRDEFLANDPEFQELPTEEQELTVSAYERTVQKGLLVPYRGLLREGGGGGAKDRPPPTAPASSSFAAIAGELPRLDEPQVEALEWGAHLRGFARSLAWCDAFRVQELSLAARMSGKATATALTATAQQQPPPMVDDCQLLHFEPALVALVKTFALRCRAAAGVGSAWPSEATQTYAEARARLAGAVATEAPLRGELESLKAIVSFHEKTDDEDSLFAARMQLVDAYSECLKRGKATFDASRGVRQCLGHVVDALAATCPLGALDNLGGQTTSEADLLGDSLAQQASVLPAASSKGATNTGGGGGGGEKGGSNGGGGGKDARGGGAGEDRETQLPPGVLSPEERLLDTFMGLTLASASAASSASLSPSSSKRQPPRVRLANRFRRRPHAAPVDQVGGGGGGGRSLGGGGGGSGGGLDSSTHSGGGGGAGGSGSSFGGAYGSFLEEGCFHGPLARFLSLSDGEFQVLEKELRAGRDRCGCDAKSLRSRIEDLEDALEVDIAVGLSEWSLEARKKERKRLGKAYGGGSASEALSLRGQVESAAEAREADWVSVCGALDGGDRLAFSAAVSASLRHELGELDSIAQGVAQRKALVECALKSHEDSTRTRELDHDWRLARCKVCRRAAARRLAKLALTQQVYGVAFALCGAVRRSAAHALKGLCERVCVLDGACCQLMRWCLCSFAQLAVKLGAALREVAGERQQAQRDTLELQKVILQERQSQGEGSEAEGQGGKGWLDDRREEARRRKEVIRSQLSDLAEQQTRLLATAAARTPLLAHALRSAVAEAREAREEECGEKAAEGTVADSDHEDGGDGLDEDGYPASAAAAAAAATGGGRASALPRPFAWQRREVAEEEAKALLQSLLSLHQLLPPSALAGDPSPADNLEDEQCVALAIALSSEEEVVALAEEYFAAAAATAVVAASTAVVAENTESQGTEPSLLTPGSSSDNSSGSNSSSPYPELGSGGGGGGGGTSNIDRSSSSSSSGGAVGEADIDPLSVGLHPLVSDRDPDPSSLLPPLTAGPPTEPTVGPPGLVPPQSRMLSSSSSRSFSVGPPSKDQSTGGEACAGSSSSSSGAGSGAGNIGEGSAAAPSTASSSLANAAAPTLALEASRTLAETASEKAAAVGGSSSSSSSGGGFFLVPSLLAKASWFGGGGGGSSEAPQAEGGSKYKWENRFSTDSRVSTDGSGGSIPLPPQPLPPPPLPTGDTLGSIATAAAGASATSPPPSYDDASRQHHSAQQQQRRHVFAVGDFATVTISRKAYVATVRAVNGRQDECDIGVLATRQLFKGVPAERLTPHVPNDEDCAALAAIAASAPSQQRQQQQQRQHEAPGGGTAPSPGEETPASSTAPLSSSASSSASAGAAALAPLPKSVPVQVPPNSEPGQSMSVVVLGRRFKFKVPADAVSGAVFQLDLANATEVTRRPRPSTTPANPVNNASSSANTAGSETGPTTTTATTADAPAASFVGPRGMDVVAGFLMDCGIDAGLAIEASTKLVESGLDSVDSIVKCDAGVLAVTSGLDASSIALIRPVPPP